MFGFNGKKHGVRRENLGVSKPKSDKKEPKSHRSQDKFIDICLNCEYTDCEFGTCKKIKTNKK